MRKFEYCVEYVDPLLGYKELQGIMNGKGAFGWELVAVMPANGGMPKLVYKKEIPPTTTGERK